MKLASFGLNAELHMLILYTFLFLLFTRITSKIEEKSINHQVKNLLNTNVGNVLDEVRKAKDFTESKTKVKLFDWKTIDENAAQILQRPPDKEEEEKIQKYNSKILKRSVYIIVFLVGLLIVTYFATRNPLLSFKDIVVENFFIFAFVAVFEYLFFTHIVMHYNPVAGNKYIKL
jgi:hypothetical protein